MRIIVIIIFQDQCAYYNYNYISGSVCIIIIIQDQCAYYNYISGSVCVL